MHVYCTMMVRFAAVANRDLQSDAEHRPQSHIGTVPRPLEGANISCSDFLIEPNAVAWHARSQLRVASMTAYMRAAVPAARAVLCNSTLIGVKRCQSSVSVSRTHAHQSSSPHPVSAPSPLAFLTSIVVAGQREVHNTSRCGV